MVNNKAGILLVPKLKTPNAKIIQNVEEEIFKIMQSNAMLFCSGSWGDRNQITSLKETCVPTS